MADSWSMEGLQKIILITKSLKVLCTTAHQGSPVDRHMVKTKFKILGAIIAECYCAHDFFLDPSRSSLKNLYVETKLGVALQAMSIAKSDLEGIK